MLLADIEMIFLLHNWRTQTPIHRYAFIVASD